MLNDFITKYTEIFCWKNERSFFSHFFYKQYWHIWEINFWKFNETLTILTTSLVLNNRAQRYFALLLVFFRKWFWQVLIFGMTTMAFGLGKPIPGQKPQQKHRLGTTSNKFVGDLGRFYTRVTFALDSVSYHPCKILQILAINILFWAWSTRH